MANEKNQLDKMQLMFEFATEPLLSVDASGKITKWNKNATDTLGWSKEDCLGQSLSSMALAANSQTVFNTTLQQLAAERKDIVHSRRFEGSAKRKNGNELPVEIIINAYNFSDGFEAFVVLRDISAVKVQEEKFNKANAFLSAIVDNIPDMIFIKEAKELRFTRFNKAGEELLGFSQNDLIGKNDYDFFPKQEADFFTSIDRNVLNHKRLVEIPEEPIQTKFKGQRILHTKKVPIYDQQGQPEFLLGISEDITDKKVAEETQRKLWQEQQARLEAEKALQLRDDFISIAAHELRTPLTTLSLQIQLLSKFEPHLDPAHKAKFTSMMTNSEDQLARFEKLVEDLLDVSRASAGMLIVDKTKEDISEIVKNVTKQLEPRFNKAGCTLKLNLEAGIIGTWDKSRIEQLITNLLSNAIKYGQGKPIEITTLISNGKAVLSVRDEGIGIAPEDQARIFNRFERAVSVKRYGGLGLGLYISQQITTAHGGQIKVQSELGKGTTFTVELPLG